MFAASNIMFAVEEFMYGASITPAPAAISAGLRWPRQATPWFIVTLVHGAVFALVLSTSLQARQIVDQVIQASLILPQPLPVTPHAPPKPPAPRPQPKPKVRHTPPPRPVPVLAAAVRTDTAPASFVVTPVPAEPVPAALVDPGLTVAAPVAAAAPAPLAPLIPPVFNANYLENPAPIYPSASRRLGEKGRVVLRVYVSALGRAEQVDIRTSSGFERLDRAALDAVSSWRFMPARRGAEAVAAWVLVPIFFTL